MPEPGEPKPYFEKPREHIGRIEKDRDPLLEKAIEEWKERLEEFINNSEQLQAMIGILKNPHVPDKDFWLMIDSWNRGHNKLSGYCVEKEIIDREGRILVVTMDHGGNIRLTGRTKIGEKKEE